MEILTFSETARHFGVSLPTISRWVREGKLVEGGKAGKNKTVTKESIEALSDDKAFQIGLEATKRRQSKAVLEKDSKLENLERRLEEIEKIIAGMAKDYENLRKSMQSCKKKIEKTSGGKAKRTSKVQKSKTESR